MLWLWFKHRGNLHRFSGSEAKQIAEITIIGQLRIETTQPDNVQANLPRKQRCQTCEVVRGQVQRLVLAYSSERKYCVGLPWNLIMA